MKTKPLALVLLGVVVIFIIGLYVLYSPQSPQFITQNDAIDTVIKEFPQLVEYQFTDLPPSSIESKQTLDGWYLGFIRRGSGVMGILNAACYFVDNNSYVTLIGEYKPDNNIFVNNVNLNNCEPIAENQDPEPTPSLPDENTGLRLGALGNFNTISIRPLSIEEDSRCPIDVTCIQAGTVRLKIEVISGTATSINTVTLGQELETMGVKIVLTSVTPESNSKKIILENEYRFNFIVQKQDEPIVIDQEGECYIGGCSGQICSENPGVITTCEYREEYACYKTATCERQTSGECGWTQTSKLNECLQGSAE